MDADKLQQASKAESCSTGSEASSHIASSFSLQGGRPLACHMCAAPVLADKLHWGPSSIAFVLHVDLCLVALQVPADKCSPSCAVPRGRPANGCLVFSRPHAKNWRMVRARASLTLHCCRPCAFVGHVSMHIDARMPGFTNWRDATRQAIYNRIIITWANVHWWLLHRCCRCFTGGV